MNTFGLAGMLTQARLRARSGTGVLDVLAVVAFSFSSWLTLTTLGGVYMFWHNTDAVNAAVASRFGEGILNDGLGQSYFALAVVALALLTVPLLSLGGAAARLGAGGRERRLASLRLIGMSSRQVLGMSVLESVLQASLGFVIGLVAYFGSLPAWKMLTFGTLPINPSQMLLPWWALCATFFLMAVIAALSTVIGLQRVSISPLGVAHRIIPPSVKMWRMAVLAATLVGVLYMTSLFSPSQVAVGQIISIGVTFLLFIGGISFAGPLLIQLTMRPLVLTSSPALLVGIRRVVSDSRGAWRNISAIALMGVVATLASTLSFVTLSQDVDSTGASIQEMIAHDIRQGVMIAFAFALIIGAVSTLIHQSSDVFDRAGEARTLVHVGTPVTTLIRARFIQVLLPLVAVSAILVALSLLPALANPVLNNWSNLNVMGVMILSGLVLTALSVAVTIPIQYQVVYERVRRND